MNEQEGQEGESEDNQGDHGYQQQRIPPPVPYQERNAIREVPGTHPVWLAAICAIVLCGTGQIVNKQVAKGVVMMVAFVFGGAVTLRYFGSAGWIVWAVAFVDAMMIGARIHRGEKIGQWQCF